MHQLKSILTFTIILSIGLTAAAEDKDRMKIAPKAEKYQSAKFVDFASELELSFDSLSSLGDQIEKCRKAADPVGLANTANLLKTAEKVSGKKASLTSEELTKEAVELAKLREVPTELKAIAQLTGQGDLKQLAATLQEEQSKEESETDKDLDGDLHVHNHSHEGFYIYANGRYLGYVAPHGHRTWHLHHVHYVDARNRWHRYHRHIHGHVHHYDFEIRGHH